MAQPIKKQSYLKRDYESIRQDLIEILKIHYPDQWQDFNSASAGMSLVELLAYVSDLLSYYTDKKFNEQFLDGVTDRASVYRLAKTLGYKPPGFRPAVTLVDVTIEVPPTADGPDTSYLPRYRPGMQVRGGGQTFETIYEIDFSSDYSEVGTANRKIEPIFNANQDILRYKITKRELSKAGVTKVFKKEITEEDAATNFLEIFLPEVNVLEIISVIEKPQTGLVGTPSFEEFSNFDIRYFEVEELAQDTIFMEVDDTPTVDSLKIGNNIPVVRRFIKDFMSDGSCKITFGGGSPDTDAYSEYLSKMPYGKQGEVNISTVLDNSALGNRLQAGGTLYVKYRVGGGPLSNVGVGVLTQVGGIDAVILGSNATTNQQVISSTKAVNVLAANGGVGLPSVDEIRYNAASNFASQKRCVTLNDYISRAFQMPGKFGAPFRISGKVEDNKIKMYILSKDANGKIQDSSTSTVKNNLVEYLIPYRMINDFVEINDGKVINISTEADLFVDKNYNSSEVKANALNVLKDFFNVENAQMNQNIYISQIYDILRDVPGVINVIDVRMYNMEGGGYSRNLIAQATGQREMTADFGVFRTQIEYIDNAVYGSSVALFETRFPDKDIRCRVS